MHAHLTKGSRGFGFNIVGGSKPDEFLQVYSVTSDGPSNLKTGMSQGKKRLIARPRAQLCRSVMYGWI